MKIRFWKERLEYTIDINLLNALRSRHFFFAEEESDREGEEVDAEEPCAHHRCRQPWAIVKLTLGSDENGPAESQKESGVYLQRRDNISKDEGEDARGIGTENHWRCGTHGNRLALPQPHCRQTTKNKMTIKLNITATNIITITITITISITIPAISISISISTPTGGIPSDGNSREGNNDARCVFVDARKQNSQSRKDEAREVTQHVDIRRHLEVSLAAYDNISNQ